MGTLRLLLALGLIALGTTGAALAISGYFEPRQSQKEAKGSDAASKAKLEMGVLKPRQRFVAIEAKTKPAGAPSATPSKAKATSVLAKAPAKKPPLAKDGSKDANVQQAAAWWPLANLFKN